MSINTEDRDGGRGRSQDRESEKTGRSGNGYQKIRNNGAGFGSDASNL